MQKLLYWFPVIMRILSGQALVQAANLITALIILRLLPLEEYALFVVANIFINIGSTGSDLNLSNALTTYGAKQRDDKKSLSGLFSLISQYRVKLFFLSSFFAVLIAPAVFSGHDWTYKSFFVILIQALISVWMQQRLTLRVTLVNIHHNEAALLKISVTTSMTRLAASIVICGIEPTAIAAMSGVLVSNFAGYQIAKRQTRLYVYENCPPDENQKGAINKYIVPLLPSAIFYLVQGQASIVLVSMFCHSSIIAEVGALSRFAQLFVILSVLNNFIIQPKFARIDNPSDFSKKSINLIVACFVAFGLIFVSAVVFPQVWLLLLGKNYSHLKPEVPLAILAPIANYMHGILFSLLLSRAYTKGQNWYVAATVVVQVVFVCIMGVDTTQEALMLNALSAIAGMLVEVVLLAKYIFISGKQVLNDDKIKSDCN